MREEWPVEPPRDVRLEARAVPSCVASTASTDWLPTAVKSAARSPGAVRDGAPEVRDRRGGAGARAHVVAAADVVGRWNAWTNELDVAVPVTSVNTTSVNIASVVPVRNRAASG